MEGHASQSVDLKDYTNPERVASVFRSDCPPATQRGLTPTRYSGAAGGAAAAAAAVTAAGRRDKAPVVVFDLRPQQSHV